MKLTDKAAAMEAVLLPAETLLSLKGSQPP